jgi:hypothetical protein
LTGIEKRVKYAYLTTLVGVVLAAITTAYTAIRPFMFSQRFRANPPGNFTGTRQFVNMNPYGGFVNNFALLGVIIAIIGVIWLGLLLRTHHS